MQRRTLFTCLHLLLTTGPKRKQGGAVVWETGDAVDLANLPSGRWETVDTVWKREMKFLAPREMGERPKRSGRRERVCFLVKKTSLILRYSRKNASEIHVMIESTHMDISQCTFEGNPLRY